MWDARGLAARSTRDGNFSSLGYDEREMKEPQEGRLFACHRKKNISNRLPESSAEVSAPHLQLRKKVL